MEDFSFFSLPDECILSIFGLLSNKSLSSMMLVSKSAHRCALDPSIWRRKIAKKGSLNIELDQYLPEGLTWRRVYYLIQAKKVHNRGCSRCHLFPISGPMYKCFHCANFFLCEDCHTHVCAPVNAGTHETGHLFVKLRHPDAASASMLYYQFPTSKCKQRTHSATCADCGASTLTGSKYKCKSCSNFTLCEKCHARASRAKQQSPGVKRHRQHGGHDSSHDFLEILFTTLNPHGQKHDTNHTAPTWCDSCTQPITSNRYKCLNCFNYDLCEQCEAAEKHRDGAHHYFLEVVRGVSICCYNIQFLEWHELNEQTKSIINVQRIS